MSDPKDRAGQPAPDLTSQGNAPSWVDEVLGSRSNLSGSADLKLPQTPPPPPRTASSQSADLLRDFVQPLSAPAPDQRVVVRPSPVAQSQTAWPEEHQPVRQPQGPKQGWPSDPQPQLGTYSSDNVSQQKLIAGLLAIFLGSLGVHKFYLGLTTPGLITLGVNVGVWILALVLGLVTLGIGLLFTLPVAGFVSSVLAVLGLVEGIIYLTKSDADFQREYLINKKPWL